ncbi:dTMP kinase [Paenibacillus chitinolyticus]|uniref:Thymidylate kinase n=1 Tax=Paenibacillus chitinolyticus TaxID=79263 RepID=A0A410WQK5_9BACL|nr:dTMP kinase [Paenibacillus chitinolyticus]MCY9592396.1 dTMP kinase [Paenibacillus chitinolyticus]MCY9599576.1 dTMP kinase [Paenibacillus chitinolyticus]QAV16716.1 dTMP kinase [Paenibacillus chitinolyticus]
MKELFLTFEGPDGSGKTTQLRRLAESLQALGYDTVVTREPGGTPISDHIRSLVLTPDHKEMADHTEVLLYAASRAQHVREFIVPALKANRIVLCDRFVDASLAYQAYGLGISFDEVAAINRFATGGLEPTRTYLLDVPVETSRQRLLARTQSAGGEGLDRIEQKGEAYHTRVREGFMKILEQNPKRICLIDADRTQDEIAHDILQDCKQLLDRVFFPKPEV